MNWYRGSKPRIVGMTGRPNSAVCDVRSAGPTPLAKRRTVTVVSGLRSRKSRTAPSASTMSRSMGVRGAFGRRIVSVKNAGSSCSQP
jgi:hypothetical protein